MDNKTNSNSIFSLLKTIWGIIDNSTRIYIYILVPMVVISGILEIITIGAIVPFIKVISDPNYIKTSESLINFFHIFNYEKGESFSLFITIVFVLLVGFSGIVRVAVTFFQTKLSFRLGHELSAKIYKNILRQEYESIVSINSSEYVTIIVSHINNFIFNVVMPLLSIISSVISALFILGYLFYLNSEISTYIFSIITFIYFLIYLVIKNKLKTYGFIIANKSKFVIQNLQEGFGAIREIILNRLQFYFELKYVNNDKKLKELHSSHVFIGQAPKFFFESFSIALIAVIAYSSNSLSGVSLISVLAAFALGAQKLLPVFQGIFTSISNIKGSHTSLEEIAYYLSNKSNLHSQFVEKKEINFNKGINFQNISFSYRSSNKVILKDISLFINKGEKIGIIGNSGSGKSTLIDIIMGLLKPTAGSIYIDNDLISAANIESWRDKITNVPQELFFTDNSVAENIAFGVQKDNINLELVNNSAKLAGIYNEIICLPNGFDTRIGERGMIFSGGQRQRIGIARAIYKRSELIILDEATSALDEQTELEVLNSLFKYNSNLTIIMITHRKSTLKYCDRVFSLKSGILGEVLLYN